MGHSRGILLVRLEKERNRLERALRPGENGVRRFIPKYSTFREDPLKARPEQQSLGPAAREAPTHFQDRFTCGLRRQNQAPSNPSRAFELLIDLICQLLGGSPGVQRP